MVLIKNWVEFGGGRVGGDQDECHLVEMRGGGRCNGRATQRR